MTNSEKLFNEAQTMIPGGVNSPVRAFQSVGGNPVYVARGNGAYIFDEDGNEYLDFCASWGPLILGHAHPVVVEAVQQAAVAGLSYGTCCKKEVEMAKLLTSCIPGLDMVRLVNSGTEATMTALRLARGYTGRNKILKFAGCYHGHTDYLLVSAGSGLLTSGISSSAGVSDQAVSDMLLAPFNDLEAAKTLFEEHGSEIAAVIVEPIAGNMGLVEPVDGFLELLRDLTTASGSLLILDEVITGFRLGATTYGNLCGINPDLTCLGKIIGGGMPIGGFGGKKEIMEKLAPLGAVYQAGTLSGNPVALSAGIATIQTLIEKDPYARITELGSHMAHTINDFARENQLKIHCKVKGGMFTIFFTNQTPLTNIDRVKTCDTDKFAAYHRQMLNKGFYLSPSQFELGFISAVHTREDIDSFINALKEAMVAVEPV